MKANEIEFAFSIDFRWKLTFPRWRGAFLQQAGGSGVEEFSNRYFVERGLPGPLGPETPGLPPATIPP